MRKIIFFIILLFSSINSFAENKEEPLVAFSTTLGTFQVVFFKEKQPDLVDFFLKAVNSGFYNNLIFHRIIDGFVIQSGAYDEKFNLKSLDFHSRFSVSHTPLKNAYGTLSLILKKDNSTSSLPQFFINLADNSNLNSNEGNTHYEVIGKVISGMEVIEKIAHIKVGQREGMHNTPFYPNESLITALRQL